MRISDWSSDVCSSDLFGDQPHDLARGLGIERGGRLVHQQQLRALRQSAADADPLPLAAGKLVGPLVHHVVEADAAEQAESLIDVRLRALAEPDPPEADVAEAPGEHVLYHRESTDQDRKSTRLKH